MNESYLYIFKYHKPLKSIYLTIMIVVEAIHIKFNYHRFNKELFELDGAFSNL